MKAIRVSNLTKTFQVRIKQKGFLNKLKGFFKPVYKQVVAVDNISFEVNEGEAIAFIGPNGAGKSTTIKMLTGVLYPSSGELEVLGINPTKQRTKLAYRIGSVIGQKEQLWVHLPAYDNFKFFGSIYDIPKQKLNERIEYLATLFEIKPFMHQPVKTLSLGQRMRCEMVASLLHEPQMLFFDEPTIGLDPIAKETLRTLIKTINKELSTTIFFTSHDVGDIEEVCKRVIIINKGKIMLDDSMKNLKYNYLKKKMIDVKLKREVTLPSGEGFAVVKAANNSLKIEVDLEHTSIADVIARIESDNILDITISSTPLEEIIKSIYRKEE